MSSMNDQTGERRELHDFWSAPSAGFDRHRCDRLFRFAVDPSCRRHDAGLLAAAPDGLFRQRSLSRLAVQLCLSSRGKGKPTQLETSRHKRTS